MRGRIEDFGNRQDKRIGSLINNSAGFLLSRLIDLVNQINVSIGLIQLNDFSSYVGVMINTDENLKLRQDISEFLGILFYMQNEHKKLLLPYKAKINKLKIKLGIYFI